MEIGLITWRSLYFICLLYVSSFDIDLSPLSERAFFIFIAIYPVTSSIPALSHSARRWLPDAALERSNPFVDARSCRYALKKLIADYSAVWALSAHRE